MQINSRLFAYFALKSNLNKVKYDAHFKIFWGKGGSRKWLLLVPFPNISTSKHFADHVPMNLREANEAALCSSKMSRCLQYGGITRSLDKVSRITPVTVLQTVILRKHSIITGQMLQNKNVYYNSLILKCDDFNNSCSASLAIKFYWQNFQKSKF